MKLDLTRAMAKATLSGSLNQVKTKIDPVFGVHVPVEVPDVPAEVLDPRRTWKDPAAYDAKARELARMLPITSTKTQEMLPRRSGKQGQI